MYSIKIEIVPTRDGETVSGTLLEQKFVNNSWSNVREHTFNSRDSSSKRNIALEDDHRLVIAARSDIQVVMDPGQRVVVVRQPVVHPKAGIIKRYEPPVGEDEGTNDTGIPLGEQAAVEFERLKRQEALEKARNEAAARARVVADQAAHEEAARKSIQIAEPPVEKPPAVMVGGTASKEVRSNG